tara:strand:+ start:317 stop:619 length:303 start_codon:yes stop_codon:yes gene_type:complete
VDWIELLERYGIPLVVAGLFWVYIQKQQKYINEELSKSLKDYFGRNESILIKLIDNSKQQQIELSKLKSYLKAIVELMSALSGNGLRDKFMRIMERNENR